MNHIPLKALSFLSVVGLIASGPCFAKEQWPPLSFPTGTQPNQPQRFLWPTKGIFSSGYGWRSGEISTGIEIANLVGTEIIASKRGVVLVAAWRGEYGYLVVIKHRDGSTTSYAHNKRLLVRRGDVVSQGQTIALRDTPYQAPNTSQKQRLRQQIEQNRRAEKEAAARKAEALRIEAKRRAEAARIAEQRRQQALAQRYRKFGRCTYDWQSWGISPSGVRSVKASCPGSTNEVAVDCTRLKVAEKSLRSWDGWKTPTPGSQEDFLVEACANVLGAPKPDYSVPQPNTKSKQLPACTPPAILCGL